LANAAGVAVYRADYRLNPSPVLRAFFRWICPKLFLHLGIADTRLASHLLGDFGLEAQKVVVDATPLRLNVRRES
jgi:hypothetical protein